MGSSARGRRIRALPRGCALKTPGEDCAPAKPKEPGGGIRCEQHSLEVRCDAGMQHPQLVISGHACLGAQLATHGYDRTRIDTINCRPNATYIRYHTLSCRVQRHPPPDARRGERVHNLRTSRQSHGAPNASDDVAPEGLVRAGHVVGVNDRVDGGGEVDDGEDDTCVT